MAPPPAVTGTAAGKVVLIGALDTKGPEYAFVRARLAAAGIASLVVDSGVLGSPSIPAEVDRATVARAGGADLAALARAADRNGAMAAMARGAATVVRRLHDDGELAAVIVLGGSNAGFVMSLVAAALPIGPPKVLVSTIVAGDTRPYVGTSDLVMFYPVVDIAGLNSVSRPVLAKAADAVIGMLSGPTVPGSDPDTATIACTMFGVTTTCVSAVQAALEAQGDEVHVFHATGTGGQTLEAMVDAGFFAAVADITTTELADELLGGVCSAGPHRLEAAARQGIPQVVSVGALDMCNFGARDTVPERFAGRLLLAHNPVVTLMRTSAEENLELGRILAEKVNASTAQVEVLVPTRGFSQISAPGGPFHNPTADAAMVEALRRHLDPRIPLHLVDAAINDESFSTEVIHALSRALTITEGSPA
ncbi:MAG: Tm-1-like ATP-binding domain-containing protein [Lapillicoccus sp.]